MTSPARAHFLRVSAAEASASAVSGQPLQDCTQYELMLIKLDADRRRLKDIQSMEAKATVKQSLLPDYQPWIDGVLSSGKGAQDDVLMTVMLWHVDAANYSTALDIADYALPYKLVMPDRFQRTTATTLAEEIADAAKRARDGNQPFDLDILLRTAELTVDEDMHDQVRAKLHKEIGLFYFGLPDGSTEQKQAALNHLQRATQLFDKVGVKEQIKKLERELKNAAATNTGDGS